MYSKDLSFCNLSFKICFIFIHINCHIFLKSLWIYLTSFTRGCLENSTNKSQIKLQIQLKYHCFRFFPIYRQKINNILINIFAIVCQAIQFKKPLMFDWIFGSNKPKEEKPAQKKEEIIKNQDMWAYDFVKQYLVSPIWRNPLLDFIEENCYVFEDTEENKFEYTKIHKQFVGLCALLLESIIEETGISEKLLQQCIMKGITDKRDRKIFQQVLLCDNFLTFKKIMVTKNKELQIAAVQAQNQKKGIQQTPQQQQIDAKELERLELQKAIALSLAMEEKIKQQQEHQLQQAIRLSQIQAEKQEKKAQAQSTKSIRELPPIVIGSKKEGKPLNEIKEEEKILAKEIENLKIKQEAKKKEQENTEQRKKRLLEQRELIRKRKMQERKQQLNAFVQNKPGQNKTQASKISQEQLQRRKKLMQRLKQQLKE